MKLAFKEWSYIVDALGKGYQSIILRKGGISEEEGEFILRGNQFLLMPTLFHQAKELIKEEWLNKLTENTFHVNPGKVEIRYYAEVVDKKLITDWDILLKLDKQHAWKEDIIRERFNRWEKSVHLLILQIYKFKEPKYIELLPQYEGCKSWVNLEEDISGEATPVIYEKIKGTYF